MSNRRRQKTIHSKFDVSLYPWSFCIENWTLVIGSRFPSVHKKEPGVFTPVPLASKPKNDILSLFEEAECLSKRWFQASSDGRFAFFPNYGFSSLWQMQCILSHSVQT
jgi:hypothetical protein